MFIARAGEITFTTHLVTRSSALRAFCASRLFQNLAHDLIGPDVRLYWDQAVYKKPGTRADFPWHQDNGYTFIEPQEYLTVLDRAHRRDARQRLSVDRPGCAPTTARCDTG